MQLNSSSPLRRIKISFANTFRRVVAIPRIVMKSTFWFLQTTVHKYLAAPACSTCTRRTTSGFQLQQRRIREMVSGDTTAQLRGSAGGTRRSGALTTGE
jgi:hypothetical protein